VEFPIPYPKAFGKSVYSTSENILEKVKKNAKSHDQVFKFANLGQRILEAANNLVELEKKASANALPRGILLQMAENPKRLDRT